MKVKTLISCLAVAGLSAVVAGPAAASGFAIGTQSGSGTGNAFAGGAAAADDASVVWYNPAAMTALPTGKHISAVGHILKPSFEFSNTGSTGVFAAPGTGEGGNGGDWALVPNTYSSMDIDPKWRIGVGINVPFGLKTQYNQGWRGRLTALKSEIKTININPGVALKLTESISIGAGVSLQKLDAELTSFSGAVALGDVTLDADDIGYGVNFGILFQATPSTRIGMSYRSSIKYELEGTAMFNGPAGGAFSGPVTADLRVPENISLSVFSALHPQWEVMGDITWTRWSRLQQLTVVRASTTAGGAAGSTLTTLPFLWENAWRFAVGANYKPNERMKVRFGVAYDQTPTQDATRTPRLPDQDRTWIAAGVQYRISKAGVVDLGYAHEFIRDANVNVTVPPFPGALVGTFENKADILTVQYTHTF